MSLTIKNDRSVTLDKATLVAILHNYCRSQNVSHLPPVDEISVDILLASTDLQSAAAGTTPAVVIKWSEETHV